MAEEENAAEAPAEKSGGMMKMVMFGGAALVLVAIGIFAGPAVMNMVSPPEEAEVAEGEEAAAPAAGPAIYQSLHPPIVVNFKDSNGDPHFMQITMEVMGRDQVAINNVRDHAPRIRNDLILLFSNAIYEEIVTREGKEKLLADGLA